jgi:hypothetical protein
MLKDLINYTPRLAFKSDGDYVEPTVVAADASDADLIAEEPATLTLPDQPLSSAGGTPQWYETIYNEKVLFTAGGTEITAK